MERRRLLVVMGESTRDDDEEENSVISRTGSVLLVSCRNVIVKAGHGITILYHRIEKRKERRELQEKNISSFLLPEKDNERINSKGD